MSWRGGGDSSSIGCNDLVRPASSLWEELGKGVGGRAGNRHECNITYMKKLGCEHHIRACN